MGECQICDDILQLFVDPRNAEAVVFGSFDQALASPCPKHTPILESFKKYVEGHRPLAGTDVGFHPAFRESIVKLFDSSSREPPSFNMFLVKKTDVAGHPGNARILDHKWVDMDLLKCWIAQCCGLHATCTTAMNTALTVPALLVDVKRRCIVSGISGCRYVALSYRFGQAPHFKLDSALLDRLKVHSALSRPDVLRLLPLTVRHAIALVETLGNPIFGPTAFVLHTRISVPWPNS